MPKPTALNYACPSCGGKCRSICTEQWQIDYVKKHLQCDDCLRNTTPFSSNGQAELEDTILEDRIERKEMQAQQEADIKCQNM